jgi:hypothetical protein
MVGLKVGPELQQRPQFGPESIVEIWYLYVLTYSGCQHKSSDFLDEVSTSTYQNGRKTRPKLVSSVSLFKLNEKPRQGQRPLNYLNILVIQSYLNARLGKNISRFAISLVFRFKFRSSGSRLL